jgi:N-methylhydantoinase B
MDALIHAPLAGTELTSTEIWETRLPIRKVSSALVTDSGGPGQWRGGLGTRIEWEFLDDMEMTLLAEKSRNSEAAGVHGGNASRTRNSIVINEGFPSSRTVGKLSGTRLRRGDRVAFVGGGGGGFGDPHARDPRLVLEDVVSGAVSAESARMQYGVAIEGSPPRLDPAATAQLRGPGMPYSPERQE